MNVSKLKFLFKLVFSGFGSAVEYVLEIINNSLSKISSENKTKVQAVLNIARNALAILNAVTWLCPVKWQTAYMKTLDSVQTVVDALSDLTLTIDELHSVQEKFADAIAAWKSPDDESCQDCKAL